MEGLQEMRDSEGKEGRFAFKEYITDEAKQYLANLTSQKQQPRIQG
jgi:pyruvate ferredoxin oxidoreductase beta subunit